MPGVTIRQTFGRIFAGIVEEENSLMGAIALLPHGYSSMGDKA
jgi:hypothetical protein